MDQNKEGIAERERTSAFVKAGLLWDETKCPERSWREGIGVGQ